jgi:hypothetical protein
MSCHFISDGWTTDDLIYRWKENDPVQGPMLQNFYGRKLQIFVLSLSVRLWQAFLA